jgi:hypothetical protein
VKTQYNEVLLSAAAQFTQAAMGLRLIFEGNGMIPAGTPDAERTLFAAHLGYVVAEELQHNGTSRTEVALTTIKLMESVEKMVSRGIPREAVSRVALALTLVEPIQQEKTSAKSLSKSEPRALRKATAEDLQPRPRLIDKIQIVIGKGTFKVSSVISRLQRRNWLPSGKNPKSYVREAMVRGAKEGRLHRVRWGVYRANSVPKLATTEKQLPAPSES